MNKENKGWNIFQKIAFEFRDFVYSIINYRNWHDEELMAQYKIIELQKELKKQKNKYVSIIDEQNKMVEKMNNRIKILNKKVMELLKN